MMHTKPIHLTAQQEELVQYATPGWRHTFEYTVIDRTGSGMIPLHWHEELQLLYVTSGTIDVSIYEQTLHLNKGEGAFINSGIIHQINSNQSNAAFICWNIGLSGFEEPIQTRFIDSLIHDQATPYMYLQPSNHTHNQILNHVFTSFQLFKEKTSGFELLINSAFYYCLYCLLSSIQANTESTKIDVHDPRVKQLLHHIHTNYDSKITLQNLANTVYLSTAETNRLFKRNIKKTPFTYILEYRLERSIDWLTRTQSTITEIAYKTGFSSASYYIEKFNQQYGMTPTKYRKIYLHSKKK